MEIPGIADLVLLGSKDSGATYIGTDTALGKLVAVRVIRSATHGDGSRFDYLVRAKGQLPKIVGATPIYRTGVLPNGEPYLVRPHYESSLQSMLANGPLNERDAIEAMTPVARTLEAAHARDVIHGDIKPSNVLLDGTNNAFVSNFGFAEYLASSASLSGAMLAPPFAPPEQFQDAPPHPSADIYSFGATLFALLVGRPPFQTPGGSSGAAEMHRIMGNDVPIDDLPNTTSPELRDFILACMSKLPANRPSSVEVTEQLNTIPNSRDQTVATTPSTAPNLEPMAFFQPAPPTAAIEVGSGGPSGKRIGLVALALSPLLILAIVLFGGSSAPEFEEFAATTTTAPQTTAVQTSTSTNTSTTSTTTTTTAATPATIPATTAPVQSFSPLDGTIWGNIEVGPTEFFAAFGAGTPLAAELDTLSTDTEGPVRYTVFAPTDIAFDPDDPFVTVNELGQNAERSEEIFSYHVVPGEVNAETVLRLNGQSLPTVAGPPITIEVTDGRVILNGTAAIPMSNFITENGTYHHIDTVLVPPTVGGEDAATAGFSVRNALNAAPQAELLARIVNRNGLQSNLEPLDEDGNPIAVTLFAPISQGLRSSGADGGDPIFSDRELATQLIDYHVVEGAFTTEDLLALDGQTLTTRSGQSIDVSVVDGEVVLNGTARFIRNDLFADDSVMHLIDTELIPPGG